MLQTAFAETIFVNLYITMLL